MPFPNEQASVPSGGGDRAGGSLRMKTASMRPPAQNQVRITWLRAGVRAESPLGKQHRGFGQGSRANLVFRNGQRVAHRLRRPPNPFGDLPAAQPRALQLQKSALEGTQGFAPAGASRLDATLTPHPHARPQSVRQKSLCVIVQMDYEAREGGGTLVAYKRWECWAPGRCRLAGAAAAGAEALDLASFGGRDVMRSPAHLTHEPLLLHLAPELAERLLELLGILDDYPHDATGYRVSAYPRAGLGSGSPRLDARRVGSSR